MGVAPATTTIRLPYATPGALMGLGIINPDDAWRTGQPTGLPGTTTLYIPPANGSGLGIVPYPNEAIRSLSGSVTLEPVPGMIPDENALAKLYGYHPVMTGWITGDTLAGPALEHEERLTKHQRLSLWIAGIGVAASVALASTTIALHLRASRQRRAGR